MSRGINISDIVRQIMTAQREAREQNQLRYDQGLEELRARQTQLNDLYGQAGNLVRDIGRGAAEETGRGAQRSLAQGRQQLISSGLGNTTIQQALTRGVEDDRQRQLRGIDEQRNVALGGLAERQGQAQFNAGRDISGFIAGRDDLYPDMGLYAQLIQAAQASNTNPVQVRLPAGGGQAPAPPNFQRALPQMAGGGGGGGGGGGSPGQSGFGLRGGGGGGSASGAQTYGPGRDKRFQGSQLDVQLPSPQVGIQPVQQSKKKAEIDRRPTWMRTSQDLLGRI
jgi:hypothetical protein